VTFSIVEIEFVVFSTSRLVESIEIEFSTFRSVEIEFVTFRIVEIELMVFSTSRLVES